MSAKGSGPATAPFRIAFRKEGDFVNCYYAEPHTMQGAVLLSSMRTSILAAQPYVWNAWKALMRQVIGNEARFATGLDIVRFDEHVAPEHERTKE